MAVPWDVQSVNRFGRKPSSIFQVERTSRALEIASREVTAWRGTDPTPTTANRGISRIPLNVDFAVKRIKIHINSGQVPGWNEIDAVGLVDSKGRKNWAARAYASSSFGRNRALPAWYEK